MQSEWKAGRGPDWRKGHRYWQPCWFRAKKKKQLNGCHFFRKGISEGGLWFYVMNLSLLGSHRGDGGGESKAARGRLPRQVETQQERKKNDSAACCFSPGPISITPLMSLLKICQRSVSALVPNVCICDCMHAECVYSCQLQTCLSYFSYEVMFLEKIQVTTECQNNFSFQFSPQLYQKQGYHLLFLLVDCFRFVKFQEDSGQQTRLYL